jgi:hypothetical protein
MKHPFMPLLLAEVSAEEPSPIIPTRDPLRPIARRLRDLVVAVRSLPVSVETGIPRLTDYPTAR